jgi:carbon-monoxide dehydrogenase medium subunit
MPRCGILPLSIKVVIPAIGARQAPFVRHRRVFVQRRPHPAQAVPNIGRHRTGASRRRHKTAARSIGGAQTPPWKRRRKETSQMIPAGFDYHAPRSVAEAIKLLADLGGDAKLLAGGHSLLPMMKLRFAQPAHLVDLNRIDALRGVREEGGTLVIGAMTVENDLIASPVLRAKAPLLPEAAAQIGDPQVRNRGTIGGDIAHGDPGNDHPALAIALDAMLVLEGPKGKRQVKADGFFLGTYMTGMGEDEILTEIRVPAFAPRTGYAYAKLKRKTGDWATAAAAVVLRLDGGKVSHVRIALTNLAPAALRAAGAEAALLGQAVTETSIAAAAKAAMAACDPAEDLRGDRQYKTAMAGHMVKRAIRSAVARCQ